MEKGAISKLLGYYFRNKEFKGEIMRASREFFNRPDLGPGKKLVLKDRGEEEAFNEWLVFDFKLKDGKTLLEDFYKRNPYNLKIDRLQFYKDLQDNTFSIFKVQKIRLGEGLVIKDIFSNKTYNVKEYSATFGLREKQSILARVGKVGDHWELVGANPIVPPIEFNPLAEKELKKDRNKITLKEMVDEFYRKEPISEKPRSVSLEQAEENLKKVLKKYDLDKFVDTKKIKKWFYGTRRISKDGIIIGLNILLGLLPYDLKDFSFAYQEVLEAYNDFYLFCPQKELGGKSPLQKGKEHEQKGIPAQPKMLLTKINLRKWQKYYKKSLDFMKKAEFKKALKNQNKVFQQLLKDKTCAPEIYRFFANKGICHIFLGNLLLGKEMLKIAHNLNPYYDFANQQLKKVKKRFGPKIMKKNLPKDELFKDPGYRYGEFLGGFNLNFAHVLDKPSPIENIKSKGKKT